MERGTVVDYMRVHPFDVSETCEMVCGSPIQVQKSSASDVSPQICGIASGLAYIHERSIVHADLKGNNILVSHDGRPLISDFGLSISDASTSLAATTNHGEKGTARWMAKELHWNPSAVSFDPRHTANTDIWAFGMVICELLTGKVPYAWIDNNQVASAISSGVLPQEPELRDSESSEILRALWLIARECWHDLPSQRPSAVLIRDRTKAISTKTQRAFRASNALDGQNTTPYIMGDVFSALKGFDLNGLIQDIEDIPFALGSTCDIFRARSSRHKKSVAVKRIRGFLVKNASYAKDLGVRVRLWSRLEHPNVLPFLGFSLEGTMAIPNIVSEYMKNGTMREYMRDRPFVAHEMCAMIYELAKGLEYLHTEQQIVHSDLKGSSILISDDGKPLIAGLLSCTYTPDSSIYLSDLESTIQGVDGTLRWMAKELLWDHPDRATASARYTTQTDMWAFGMIICELLTREVPFANLVPYGSATRNEPQILKVILDGILPEAPDLDQFENNAVFRALWSIARKCWNDVSSRRPSARDVLNGLEFFVNDL
ncbi:kinase-like protein [Schizopora paradoxa]|uniref:Kinase-like protein n=1 Tax=Schizopora paradoxa TaxID=27342 RepID=A0A0H2S940_9AGAM|nr:kinase-like protein [Schizopora paradoxa]